MSHIDVHDVAQRARARLGRSYQVAALLPPAPRPRFDQWQSARNVWALNRAPYFHALPPFAAKDISTLRLPRDEREPAEGGPAAPSAARAPTRRAAGPATPETLGWAYYVSAAAVGNTAYATTDQIPWPCRIVGFSIDVVTAATADGLISYQIFTVDSTYTGQFAGFPGSPLIPWIGDQAALAANHVFGPLFRVHRQTTVDFRITDAIVTSAALGRSMLEPGKRLAIGVRVLSGAAQDFSGNITVERIDDEPLIVERIAAARPKPPPPDPRTAPKPPAARARTAPPPPPEPETVAIRGERATQPQRQIYWIGTQPRMYITEPGKIPVDAPLGDPSLLEAGGQLQTAPRFAQPAPPVPGFLPETGSARERR